MIREEIKKVIDHYTDDDCLYPDKDCKYRGLYNYCISGDDAYKCLMKRLDEIGVVIKLKCPDCCWGLLEGEHAGMIPCDTCNSTGYIIEPLIKEGTDADS